MCDKKIACVIKPWVRAYATTHQRGLPTKTGAGPKPHTIPTRQKSQRVRLCGGGNPPTHLYDQTSKKTSVKPATKDVYLKGERERERERERKETQSQAVNQFSTPSLLLLAFGSAPALFFVRSSAPKMVNWPWGNCAPCLALAFGHDQVPTLAANVCAAWEKRNKKRRAGGGWSLWRPIASGTLSNDQQIMGVVFFSCPPPRLFFTASLPCPLSPPVLCPPHTGAQRPLPAHNPPSLGEWVPLRPIIASLLVTPTHAFPPS